MIRNLLTAATFIALGSQAVLAWDDTGHQVIASMAWKLLTPPVQEKILKLFPDDLKTPDPIIFFRAQRAPSDSEKKPLITYNHVTIANWMDDIRDDSNSKSMAEWHYIDRPFFDGIPERLAIQGSPNAREKIVEMIGVLKKVRNFDRSDADHSDDRYKAAFAVAVLSHLIGDVHQPLHAVARYSEGLEDGDQGGNLFPLRFPKAPKLHLFWDAAGGLFDHVKLGRDFDETQRKQLDEFSQRVLDRWNPQANVEAWHNFNPEDWIAESYKIGVEQVYKGIKPFGEPDGAYTEKTEQISAERIGMAAYRLALILNGTLGAP